MEKYYKILVAEDSQAIQMSIQNMLLDTDLKKYYILKAKDGHEACKIAAKEIPDLILIDIEMPVMDGITAIRKIKKQPALSQIPIIVMTSRREFADAIEAGANDFLLKPFNQNELLIRTQLNLDSARKTFEIKRQNDLLNMQKEEVVFQRDTISKQQNELIDDYKYASYIQNAVMPENETMLNYFNSNFIFNQPKNIVSGDFYWISKKNQAKIICVGDCTGHGISGALMTMAGIAFLNEIINDKNIIEPDSILNELRKRVIKLLNQKGNIGEASNGMDLSICIVNENSNKLEYAGANNPIYIVRDKKNIEILKADRMPIGIHINYEKPFTKKEVYLEKGDLIYLFSDGYADQFGGENGHKFRYDQFQKLIISMAPTSMSQQKETIVNTFNEWKGAFEQVDDVLVIGIEY